MPPGKREFRLQAFLLRHDQEPSAAMVQHEDVRQPDESLRLSPPATRDSNRSPLRNSPIINAYEPATAPPGGGDSCMDDRAPTVPILHTGSVKSANQLRFAGVFRQVCKNGTCTLSVPLNDRQTPLRERASRTASRLVGLHSGRIEQRHRHCSIGPRMSVGLRGASDDGGLRGLPMSYQAPHPVTVRGTLPPVTIDEIGRASWWARL